MATLTRRRFNIFDVDSTSIQRSFDVVCWLDQQNCVDRRKGVISFFKKNAFYESVEDEKGLKFMDVLRI